MSRESDRKKYAFSVKMNQFSNRNFQFRKMTLLMSRWKLVVLSCMTVMIKSSRDYYCTTNQNKLFQLWFYKVPSCHFRFKITFFQKLRDSKFRNSKILMKWFVEESLREFGRKWDILGIFVLRNCWFWTEIVPFDLKSYICRHFRSKIVRFRHIRSNIIRIFVIFDINPTFLDIFGLKSYVFDIFGLKSTVLIKTVSNDWFEIGMIIWINNTGL